MASEKQLQANRANARNSTGPKTLAGKARSRLNSRKHGLTAKMLIIVGENADDFDQLRAELLEEHEPQSVLECELVERLAGILWRLRRVPFFEAAIIGARQVDAAEVARRAPSRCDDAEQDDDDEMSDEELSVHVGGALIHDSTYGDGLGKLARHETGGRTRDLFVADPPCSLFSAIRDLHLGTSKYLPVRPPDVGWWRSMRMPTS
jgi:hypothetical protein